MNNLEVIKETTILNRNFKVYGNSEEPLFMAKEVADWIDHSNHRVMLETVEEDEKVVRNAYTLGGNQDQWFLTEEGLYEVLMQSRKPIAKAFKKEVKKILKDLRLYGQYNVPRTYAEALKLAARQQELLDQKNQIIGELRPKVDYLDRILKSKSLVTITQIAKDYGMSGKSMNRLLHDLGVQYKQSDQWLLYYQHQDKGYTFSETIVLEDVVGFEKVVMQTKWTQKGRIYLYNLLKDNGILPSIENDLAREGVN